ncbi:MAG: YlbF family regulator [Lachnospiraceae bacterium]|nr:YlbF family regulator [Lachnospiraceae bacterium]
MNAGVKEALDGLIKAIKEDEVYKEYHAQLDLLRQNPELKRQVDDFRKRNYEMQDSEDFDFARLNAFQDEYKTFRENPLVDSFLAAELDFCRMMQNINFDIVEAVDFD